ncbi:MAG: hypothetical protein JKY42_11060, partial [Flavobacteriales bacterium]|nr:hypothetical protein [Flavobacteriales bacterium]
TDLGFATAGAIKGVTSPEKEITTYTYELNDSYAFDFFDHINLTTSVESNRICGGIRVSEITKSSPLSSDEFTSKYYYEHVDDQGDRTGVSSGIVFNPNPIINRLPGIHRAGDNGSTGMDLCLECNFESIVAYSVDPVTSSFTDHMVYLTVTEELVSKNGNSGGKNIYYFDNYEQYPQFSRSAISHIEGPITGGGGFAQRLAQSNGLNQRISPHISSFNYINTLLTKREAYKFENAVYSLVVENEYKYKAIIDNSVSLNLLDFRKFYLNLTGTDNYYAPCFNYNFVAGTIGAANSNYPIIYKKQLVAINPKVTQLLEFEYERVYEDNGIAVESETRYSYDSYNQLTEERKSSSEGQYYLLTILELRITYNLPPPQI